MHWQKSNKNRVICSVILLFSVSMFLSSCSSNDSSTLDNIISELGTTYLDGGENAPEETYVNSESGVINAYKDGSFTLLSNKKVKIKFAFDEATVIYGSEAFGEGDAVTVSYIDSASTDHKKPLSAVIITVITSAATEASITAEDTAESEASTAFTDTAETLPENTSAASEASINSTDESSYTLTEAINDETYSTETEVS